MHLFAVPILSKGSVCTRTGACSQEQQQVSGKIHSCFPKVCYWQSSKLDSLGSFLSVFQNSGTVISDGISKNNHTH